MKCFLFILCHFYFSSHIQQCILFLVYADGGLDEPCIDGYLCEEGLTCVNDVCVPGGGSILCFQTYEKSWWPPSNTLHFVKCYGCVEETGFSKSDPARCTPGQ